MSFWGWIAVSWFAGAVALILSRAFGLTSLNWWLTFLPLVLLVCTAAGVLCFFIRNWGQP